MRFLIVVSLLVSSPRLLAAEPTVADATKRSLAFLAKDALEWKKEYKCVSCHHAGMVVWALREAKQAGHAVDDQALTELAGWLAKAGDGSKQLPKRPEASPKAANLASLMFAFGLGADAKPDAETQAALKGLWKVVRADQTDDGSYQAWRMAGPRPPLFATGPTFTAQAALVLRGDSDPASKAAVEKAVKWLAAAKPEDDAQSEAMRLTLWARAGRPKKEVEEMVQRIRGRQNKDGGWSQTKELASDAFATGQALYALATAGVGPEEDSVKKGRAFLVKTQREDGGWPMTSRPGGAGQKAAKNLVPITGAAAAWATLGLVRSSPRKD